MFATTTTPTRSAISRDREANWRYNSRRRCAAAGVPWSDIPLSAIFRAGGGRCHVCDRGLVPGDPWDADHLTALAAGGLHELANLRPCCVRCNRTRGASPAPGDVHAARLRAGVATIALADILGRLGVPVTPALPDVGPSVTVLRMRVQPGLARAALALAPEIRAALNNPRARVVLAGAILAVEIPRDVGAVVRLADMPADGLRVGIGKDARGGIVGLDLARVVHVLVAGQTGSGKSTVLRGIVAGLARSGAVQLALADDADTWAPMSRLAALIAPVATDREAVGDLCLHVQRLMDARQVGALPALVLAIDEVQRLDQAAREAVLDIAQRGRKFGVHLIVATQFVRGDVLDRRLTDNMPGRIAGRVQDGTASRLIIGTAGAELLGGAGDCLLSVGGAVTRFKAALGDAGDYAALPTATVSPTALARPDRPVQPAHPGHAAADDRNAEALQWALDQGPGVSASAIRKRFGCGMDRARLIRDQARATLAVGQSTEAEGATLPADRLTAEGGR